MWSSQHIIYWLLGIFVAMKLHDQISEGNGPEQFIERGPSNWATNFYWIFIAWAGNRAILKNSSQALLMQKYSGPWLVRMGLL